MSKAMRPFDEIPKMGAVLDSDRGQQMNTLRQPPIHAPLPSQLTERVLDPPPMLRVLGVPSNELELDAFVRRAVGAERGDRVDASPFAKRLLRAVRADQRRRRLERGAWGLAGCLAFALLLGLLGLMLAGGVR